MQFEFYRKFFIALGLIGVLLFASPAIGIFMVFPSDQQFSELYILGPSHTFENMPVNITDNVRNLIYVGIVNQMNYPTYYTLFLKIGTQNESLPSLELGLPSALPPIFEYKLLLEKGESWEAPINFEAIDLKFANRVSTLNELRINGIDFPVNKSSAWDSNKQGYYYSLIFELWAYNNTLGASYYDNRFVLLRLNMTSS